jgi:hypothetical protein
LLLLAADYGYSVDHVFYAAASGQIVDRLGYAL